MSRGKRRRGRLIALEGIDGVGKSTLARAIARKLRARGLKVVLRREPDDPLIGRLAQSASVSDPWSGAIYFTLDRHLARPALDLALVRNDIVVCDRSFYSTLAYQGSALGVRDRRRLERLQRSVTREPDDVLFLDLPPREALARLGRRNTGRGPLERLHTLERVARSYRSMARRHRWTVLDAHLPRPELAAGALEALGFRPRPTRRRTGRR
jgi:dTMP kinase